MAKNYLYKHVRAELGLPMGVETVEARDDGIIVRGEIETASPKPITYDRLKELMKEREAHERTE